VDCIGVCWCNVHVKLSGVWMQVAFLLGFGTEEVWILFLRFESCFGVI
jgi:hypothetical protein